MPVSSMTSAFFCALLFACRQTPAILSSSSSHPLIILPSSSSPPLIILPSCSRRAHCTTLAPALNPSPTTSKSYPPPQMTISFVSNILFFISLYTF